MANGKILLGTALIVVFTGLAWLVWPQRASAPPAPASASNLVNAPTSSPTSTPTPAPPATLWSPLPGASPEGTVTALVPAPEAVGWVTSLDGRSHFGFPNIHAGFLNEQVYYGAIQFDLSPIPPGSAITYAAVELVGLDAHYLQPGGKWQLHLLDPAIDAGWPQLTYDELHQAPFQTTIAPNLNSTDLAPDRVNRFTFSAAQLPLLQQHLAVGIVSFRLVGPTSGNDNLFTWY